MSDGHLLKLHLVTGSYHTLFFTPDASIRRVIETVICKFAGPDADAKWFAICIVALSRTASVPAQPIWLHSSLSVAQAMQHFMAVGGLDGCAQFEVRIRFLPDDLEGLVETQRTTFDYLYEQVRRDYLKHVAHELDQSTALQLGCLLLRSTFKDLQVGRLEKNLQYAEELGLQRFFPESVLSMLKSKPFRKSLMAEFKRVADHTERNCALLFFQRLSGYARYDLEAFSCTMVKSSSTKRGPNNTEAKQNVQIYVGPSIGVSYVVVGNEKNTTMPQQLVKFSEISRLETVQGVDPRCYSLIRLRVASRNLTIDLECTTSEIADSLAHLIDGYCRVGQVKSPTDQDIVLWSNPEATINRDSASLASSLHRDDEFDDDYADYASPISKNYDISRESVQLISILGKGQFGDVYRGMYRVPDTGVEIMVAVKTSRLTNQDSEAGNFLEEAETMRGFDHPHIIRLLGVCLEFPIWLVMELAPMGELRAYLHEHRERLEIVNLLQYAYQLSTALSYLEGRSFVHRDIAARNVLVCSAECVKLSDFGLGRYVDEQLAVYTANRRGKLPIKWMAPESINFRRFTSKSDVWMFAVCMWEILTYGVKPFQGVRNTDVVDKLENGERLPMPIGCPPRVFSLMCQMWGYHPGERPSMQEVKQHLLQLYEEEKSARVYSLGTRATSSTSSRSVSSVNLNHVNTTRSGAFSSGLPSSSSETSLLVPGAAEPGGVVVPPPKPRLRMGSPTLVGGGGQRPESSTSRFDDVLEQQKLESEEDSKWLEEEFVSLPLSSPSTQELPPSSPLMTGGSPRALDSAGITVPRATEVDRSGDKVFEGVLALVGRVKELSRNVQEEKPEELLAEVKRIGLSVRTLLTCVGTLRETLTEELDHPIKLAEQVVSKDMEQLVLAMRRVFEYCETTLDHEYRKQLLGSAHILAIDSKHFLEAVDGARAEIATGMCAVSGVPK